MSAPSLHSQLETSNRFLEIVTILQGDELECPDQPRRVLQRIARDPGVRLATSPRPGQHRAQRLRHHHRPDHSWLRGEAERRPPQPLPEAAAADPRRSWRMTGTSARMRPEAGKVILSPAFVIRVRDHRPVMASPSGPGAACAVAGVSWRGGLFAWAGASCPGGGACRLGESGCESGEEDAGASGRWTGAACGPAWLAAADHRASPSSPGAGMLSGSQCACPGDPGRGVPAAGCAGQPWPDG